MPYKKSCAICGKTFEAKRSDAQTCGDKCRKKKQEQKKKKTELAAKRKQIRQAEKIKLGETLRLQIELIEGRNEYCDQQIEKLQNEEKVLSLEELPSLYAEDAKLEAYSGYAESLNSDEELKTLKEKGILPFEDSETFYIHWEWVSKKKIYIEQRLKRIPRLIENWIEVKKVNNERIIELDNIRFTDNYKLLSPKEIESILAEDLLKKEFITFNLDGNIGYFLGDLDRSKTAITITGDSGTGKSHFVLYLAEMFLKKDFTVRYFSLEMKFGKVLQEMVSKYDCAAMDIVDSGTIEDIKKSTKNFDVIIIDSFSKLSTNAKDFDLLTEAHKETIFICIFQKTNSGRMRGGAAVRFDSFMTIEIVKREDDERIAIIEKSRNGRTDWEYSITHDEVLKQH